MVDGCLLNRWTMKTPSLPLNIRFRVIPEPGPVALLAVGGLLLVGVLNHRRNS